MAMVAFIGVSSERFHSLYEAPILFYLVLVLAVLILLAMINLKTWFFARRRILRQLISVGYTSPLGLNPAEISYLFRRELDDRDFAGLLAYMSQKGVIHFRKHDGVKMIYPGPKYEGNLKAYEKIILDVIDDNKPVAAKEFIERYREAFAAEATNRTLKEHVRDELIKSGYLHKKPIFRRSIALLMTVIQLLSLTVWLPLVVLWIRKSIEDGTSDFSKVVDVLSDGIIMSLYLFIPLLFIVVLMKHMQARAIGRRWIIQPKLLDFWAQIIGFRQFVRLTECGKLRFESKELEKTSLVNTLPYAIALGFVANWRDIIS